MEAVKPCLTALRAERALPSVVRGPVERAVGAVGGELLIGDGFGVGVRVWVWVWGIRHHESFRFQESMRVGWTLKLGWGMD